MLKSIDIRTGNCCGNTSMLLLYEWLTALLTLCADHPIGRISAGALRGVETLHWFWLAAQAVDEGPSYSDYSGKTILIILECTISIIAKER